MKGKTVFITGASSGIGASLAREYAKRGANLILTARRLDRLEQLESELRAVYPSLQILCLACDVSRDSDLPQVVQTARTKFDSIDVVVANAGFGVVGRVEELTLEDYRRQFETNVYGVLRTIHATLPDLKKSRGSFAIVGSVNGHVALPGNSPYSMSKFSVRALAQALYYELRAYGISVTHISPGFVTTEIRQVDNSGRMKPNARDPIPEWLRLSSDAAARVIVRGVARRKREQPVTRHAFFILFLNRHFPNFVALIVRSLKIEARSEAH